jgi:hypothetical protein
MEHQKFKIIKWGFLEANLIYPIAILERRNDAPYQLVNEIPGIELLR